MAYSTSTPPALVSQGISPGGGLPRVWHYFNTDADTVVYAAGYFSDGQTLGMKKGDIVYYHKTDGPDIYIHLVVSLSTTDKSVTLSSTNVTHLS